MGRRHDAQFSRGVIEVLAEILTDEAAPVAGPLVDPFAGMGLKLAGAGRADIVGIELEPEWAAASDWVRQGDALDPSCYPERPGAIVTSPCYGNRLADQYLGPACGPCSGSGRVFTGEIERFEGYDVTAPCEACAGSGRNGRGRYGYAISLGRRVSAGSSAALQWGHEYRVFHERWLRVIAGVLEPGERRLILNMSDHYRARQRQYVCSWWVSAAHGAGFRLVDARPADTARIGHGQNAEKRAEREMVFVFDFLSRAWKTTEES